MEKFVHLHNHTEYSLLDGAAKVEGLVKMTKERGWDAVAITDHGNMYGALQFYTACLKAGIKPIIGCEFYSCYDMHHKQGKADMGHLILLAKNNTGYQNLLKLNSIAFTEGFYYKPRIDYELLEKYSEGLICLSACLAGHIPQLILENRYEDAKALALKHKQIFGEDFYLEIQNHGIPEQKDVMLGLKKISDETGIKLVATNDCHYLQKEDAEMQDILMCIQMGKTYDDPDRMKFSTDEFYYKDYDEMKQAMVGFEEALATTLEIADKCNVVIKSKAHYEMGLPSEYCLLPNENFIPFYKAPNGQDNYDFLHDMCYDGLKKKYGEITPQIKERADFELNLIKEQGYVEYFLVVWDYINYARSAGIPVGPGRGSGAGSIVAYAISITLVDPLKYDLLFERFIHRERVSMPDFDVDFEPTGRADVIEYVKRKYNAENVANIGTFGTMAAKNAIKDTARALKIPYSTADRITKLIPGKPPEGTKPHAPVLKIYFGMSGEEKFEKNKIDEIIELYNSDEEIKKLVDLAIKLEGMPRQTSIHACGVLIAPEPVQTYVPLSVNGGEVATQYSMTELEQLGLLKMDFLGLNTLTDIYKALDYIKENHGVEIDFYNMEYNDKNVYDLLGTGNTDAIFQLESGGFKKFLKELKPTCLEDIIAGVSLYRPGPMAYIPKYVNNKHHPENITYAHPCLEPILNVTYGVIVYQEQVMKICQVMGGYNLGQADNVRRIMGKKKKDKMAAEKEKFIYGWEDPEGKKSIAGAIKLGIPKEVAEDVFGQMEAFASYAFNKSHAAAYAYVSYQTAYLKCYYPLEFMTSVINNRITNADEIKKYMNVARAEKINILPPSINKSKTYFATEGKDIRYGLSGLKGVGIGVIEEIIKERTANGVFTSFEEFAKRMSKTSSQALNKKCVEALILSGAFDEFGVYRSQLASCYETIIDKINKDNKNTASGQTTIFDCFGFTEIEKFDEIKYPNIKEYAKNQLLKYEKEFMGVYMSGHPLDEYADKFNDFTFTSLMIQNQEDEALEEEFEEIEGEEAPINDTLKDGSKVTCGGILIAVKRTQTKATGKDMAILTVEDLYGTFDVMLFPKMYDRFKNMLEIDKMYTITGNLSIRDGEAPIIMADNIKAWSSKDEEIKVQEVVVDKKLYLKFDTTNIPLNEKISLKLDLFSGDCPVVIKCETQNRAFKYEHGVNANNLLINELIGLLGEQNVVLKDL